MMKGRIAAAVLGCLLPVATGAQTTGDLVPLVLTLDEAVRRGIETSHRMEEAISRGEAAVAVADQRLAAARPQLTAEAGYSRTNHVDEFGVPVEGGGRVRTIFPDIPDNYRTRLSAHWPLYTGGRVEALERAARTEAAASERDLTTLRADLRLEIAEAYWGLLTATESLGVVEAGLVRIGAHLEDMRNRLAAGLVPPHEVLTVEAEQSQQRVLQIRAQMLRDVGEAELARLIGAPPGTPIRLASPLEPPGVLDRSVDRLMEDARTRRSDRAALVDRLRAAAEREAAAAAGVRPTVAVVGGVDYARPNPRIFPRAGEWRPSWDAGVNLIWPLTDGGRTRAEVAEAAAARRALDARLSELDAVLAVELRRRLSELQAGLAAIAASDDSIRAATEARRVVGERFAAGVATSTEVLDAEGVILQAALARTQAIAEARLAEARLDRVLGR